MTRRVTYSCQDGLARIELAAPDTANALDEVLASELHEAAQQCAADPAARALLISAQGKHFTVGGSLAIFRRPPAERLQGMDVVLTNFHGAVEQLLGLDIPVVTAAQGAAAGAGMTLALLGDLVFVADDFRLSPAFAAIGVSADGGSTWLLPRRLGPRLAAELLVGNREMGAEEALAHGLVSEVVAPADLLSHALAKAKALASGPTQAYRSTKQLLRASPSNGFAEQSALEGAHIKRHAVSPDGEEGVAAFTEHRPPHFTGNR